MADREMSKQSEESQENVGAATGKISLINRLNRVYENNTGRYTIKEDTNEYDNESKKKKKR
jgi:hypothetical protein